MELIKGNFMLLDVLPDVGTSPRGQRAEFEQVVFPVPSHHWRLSPRFGLASPQSCHPNVEGTNVFFHRNDFADVATQIWIIFPQLVAVCFGLLFDADFGGPTNKLDVVVFGFQFFAECKRFRKEESGVDPRHR